MIYKRRFFVGFGLYRGARKHFSTDCWRYSKTVSAMGIKMATDKPLLFDIYKLKGIS